MPDTNLAAELRQKAQDLRAQAAQLNRAAEGLETSIRELEDANPQISAERPGARTAEGLKKIREANRNFWVPCPKPSCGGVRHRRTHPHIRSSRDQTKKSA